MIYLSLQTLTLVMSFQTQKKHDPYQLFGLDA